MEFIDDEIKQELKKITNEFSQVEIDWLKALTYPATAKICVDKKMNNIMQREVLRITELDDIDDLYSVFKVLKYPQYLIIPGAASSLRIDVSNDCEKMEEGE